MKTVKKVCALAVMIMATAASGPALALPDHWTEYHYFSDETYTTQVGVSGLRCNGRSYGSGTQTIYEVLVIYEPCS